MQPSQNFLSYTLILFQLAGFGRLRHVEDFVSLERRLRTLLLALDSLPVRVTRLVRRGKASQVYWFE